MVKSFCSVSIPKFLITLKVFKTSSLLWRLLIFVGELARAPQIRALWETDLSPGILICPLRELGSEIIDLFIYNLCSLKAFASSINFSILSKSSCFIWVLKRLTDSIKSSMAFKISSLL